MSTTSINIRTDSETKTKAQQIFSTVGLDMTTAINLFLRQTVRMNDIPFVISARSVPLDTPNPPVYGRGCMKGKMQIADDFDAPLEEMREYME